MTATQTNSLSKYDYTSVKPVDVDCISLIEEVTLTRKLQKSFVVTPQC